jgi:hypothetical protein
MNETFRKRKREMQSLQPSKRRLTIDASSIPDGLIDTDGEGKLQTQMMGGSPLQAKCCRVDDRPPPFEQGELPLAPTRYHSPSEGDVHR